MSDDELKEKYPSMFARSSIGFDFYEGLMQGWMVSEGHFTFIDLAPLHLITGPGPDRLFEHKHNR